MEKKEIFTVRSIRAKTELLDRLSEIAKESFTNQSEALEALINTYDMQSAKTALPARQTEIANFDAHLQALSTAFLNSLEIAESADLRASAGIRSALESKDNIIADLQAQLTDARAQIKAIQDEQSKATETNNRITEQAAQTQAELDETKKQYERLQEIYNARENLIADLTKQVERTRENETERIRAATAQETINLQNQIIELMKENNNLKAQLTKQLSGNTTAAKRKTAGKNKETAPETT